MTNVEIEDVLSSIRRLVSEETHVLKARKPDRLMLTPAFRVAEPKAAAAMPTAEARPVAEVRPVAEAKARLEPSARVSLEDRIAALEAQIGGTADDFEPDGSEDQAQHIPRSMFRTVRDEPPAPPEVEAPAAEEPAAHALEAEFVFVANKPTSAAEVLAALERKVAERAQGPSIAERFAEPLTDLDAAPARPDTVLPTRPGVAAEGRAARPSRPELVADAPRADVVDEPTDDVPTEAVVVEGSTAPVPPDEAEATGTPRPEVVAEAPPDPDPLEVLRAALPGSPEPDEVDDLLADGASATPVRRDAGMSVQVEEALIDEEALREIVGSLVREELRGELGERITRNVRRLIRREIHRALTLQGMEEDDED
jgi:hypothetical protein